MMTNQERKLVIEMHNDGKSYKEISEHFNVNKNTIKEIIKKYENKKNEIVMMIPTINKIGTPNSKGLIYTKEEIKKAVSYNRDSNIPIYLTTTSSIKEQTKESISTVNLEDILGEVIYIGYDLIKVKFTDINKYNLTKSLIDDGYKAGLRCIGKRRCNELINIKIICFDIGKPSK